MRKQKQKKIKEEIREELFEFVKDLRCGGAPTRLEDWMTEVFSKILQRFIEETTKELREELAELEHKQWKSWTIYLGSRYELPSELVKKWGKNWKPYSELTEEEKDKDRIWADRVLERINQTQAKWIKENL